MLNMSILLDVRYYDGSAFTNYKVALGQAVSDTAEITLDTDNYIYIGYYKPLTELYFDIATPNTNSSTLTYEYFNGTDWSSIESIDDTSSLERSGLVQWEEISDWSSNEIDSTTKYWIRISTDTLHSAAVYNFIGLIYADDRSLLVQNPYITSTNLLMGQSSHFRAHIAARDELIQTLTNKGYTKIDEDGIRQPITAWDLLDISEVRMGATYLALAIIYFNLSDDPEDHWMAKAIDYRARYESQIKLVRLSIDIDDDGIIDSNEKQAYIMSGRMIR